MKRSPIQRRKPLVSRSALSRSALPKTGKPRARSAKRDKWQREQRVPFVVALLAERPWCEIQQPFVCTGRSVDVDEIKLRSQGGSATDPSNCLAVCRACHDWKHANPLAAEAAGFYRRGSAA